jgi:hypothetical protein
MRAQVFDPAFGNWDHPGDLAAHRDTRQDVLKAAHLDGHKLGCIAKHLRDSLLARFFAAPPRHRPHLCDADAPCGPSPQTRPDILTGTALVAAIRADLPFSAPVEDDRAVAHEAAVVEPALGPLLTAPAPA